MRWEDERYVRLYTRDTIDWLALSFEAQGLLSLLLRKVDRAGILPLGKHGRRGVAASVGHAARWSTIEPALAELEADGCLVVEGDRLVMPNFIEAQEAPQSESARKRSQRERDRDKAMAKGLPGEHSQAAVDILATMERAEPVTKRDEMSRPVVTPEVTKRDRSRDIPDKKSPLPSVPSVPSRAEPFSEPVGGLADGIDATFRAKRGHPYVLTFADERAVERLLGLGDVPEILRRWGICLDHTYPAWDTVHELARNWNACAAPQSTGPPKDVRKGVVMDYRPDPPTNEPPPF